MLACMEVVMVVVDIVESICWSACWLFILITNTRDTEFIKIKDLSVALEISDKGQLVWLLLGP